MQRTRKLGHPLVEVDSFLSELSRSVLGILVRLVLDHLHALAAFALLVAVFADHVELTDPVLKDKEQKCKEIRSKIDTGQMRMRRPALELL